MSAASPVSMLGRALLRRCPMKIVAPILLYPWSRQLWLAVDLILRPAESGDFTAPSSPGTDIESD